MKKILHVVSSMNAGGVENVVYSYVSLLDKKKYECDVACYTSANGAFRSKFEEIGINIYKMPPKRKLFSSFLYLYKLLKKNQYDIIHVHLDDQSFMALFSAFCAHIQVRIIHTHLGVYFDNKPATLHKIMKRLSLIFANRYFACSEKSAAEFYGGRFNECFIMYNGIDVRKYEYCESKRNDIREKYGINANDIVIGNVARLTEQKNPFFVLDVFQILLSQYNNIKLMLVGDGFCLEKIKGYIKEKSIEDKVILTGASNNAGDYYNALDIFFLPSKFEGFGISFIEAQVNGLKTIASNMVPEETRISNNICYLPLDDGKGVFVDKISDVIDSREYGRKFEIESNKYDISKLINRLEAEYEK